MGRSLVLLQLNVLSIFIGDLTFSGWRGKRRGLRIGRGEVGEGLRGEDGGAEAEM